MADRDILEFVQSSKNIINADSGDENEMNNAVHVPTSSELRNIMKSLKRSQARQTFHSFGRYHAVYET
ncbi:hypothetical protein TNCV_4575361 [Trichonephila clavipes]|nr:hypothetical protein TNCV_4575361 [Trichonephila clavipes]